MGSQKQFRLNFLQLKFQRETYRVSNRNSLYLNALNVTCDALVCLWQLTKVNVPKL